MSPSPREIELERAEVTPGSIDAMDDAAEFGMYFQRSGGDDLRACAGQLPGFNLEPARGNDHQH